MRLLVGVGIGTGPPVVLLRGNSSGISAENNNEWARESGESSEKGEETCREDGILLLLCVCNVQRPKSVSSVKSNLMSTCSSVEEEGEARRFDDEEVGDA
jgi:hypothetical protein